jgi:N-acetylmuramic acid 6-phosphate etherase
LSTSEILKIINREDHLIANQVKKILPKIELLIIDIVKRLQKKGKLYYIGCGTSGRLGVLDASECPPTFSTESNLVQGIIAGGDKALKLSVENAEDSIEDGKNIVTKKKINKYDVLIGISASGTAQYVHGALSMAHKLGSCTALICCNKYHGEDYIDHILPVIVGPEIIAGSTRMKAGTATKMILNMISTTSMIKLNKVYDNLMVDLQLTNNKLLKRGIDIVVKLTGTNVNDAKKYLKLAKGSVKIAVIMKIKHLNYDNAEIILNNNEGDLNKILKNS